MRTRLLLVLGGAALLAAACSGVLFDTGNAFPCHFDDPPGLRDLACAPGDVCGVSNVCQHYVNEGPRFEGPITLPDFSAASGAGTLLHPRILNQPVQGVGLDPLGGLFQSTTLTEGDVDYDLPTRNDVVSLDGGTLPLYASLIPLTRTVTNLLGAALLQDAGVVWVAVRRQPNDALFIDASGPGGRRTVPLLPAKNFTQLRAVGTQLLGLDHLKVVGIDRLGVAGELSLLDPTAGIRFVGPTFSPYPVPGDAGVLDVAWASRPGLESPVLLTRTDVLLQADDGGFFSAATLPAPISNTNNVLIKSDPRSNVYAVMTQTGVLSTWMLVRNGPDYAFEQAWNDCTPCGGLGRPLAFTPVFKSSGTVVEVLCGSVGGGKVGVRVVGSNATDSSQRCDLENFDLPFNPGHLVSRLGTDCGPGPDASFLPCVQDVATQAGVALGGSRGEAWLGTSLSQALPLYLDRVPLDVTLATVPNGSLLVALTDRYIARSVGPDSNGLLAAKPLDDSALVGADLSIAALLHQSGTWVLTGSGDLAELNLDLADGGKVFRLADGTAPPAQFGPRLVNGRGQAISNPLVGEAYVGDGGVRSAMLAIDDSLYFVPFDFVPADTPGVLPQLGPVLTPEPSTVIRSLALERTPIGSNGVDRMRGYLVTSRNVYQFALAGTPPRWTATPVFLWGGEPVETWFDQPRGGLARVGYRDGTIFTLPGGFQLAEALPAGDAGVTAAVQDFENLGGWPVALASTGLFVAGWAPGADGRPDLHFPDGGVNKPMSWTPISLPDGGRPWMGADGHARAGKLFVRVDPTVPADGGYQTTFHLLLFMDDQVIEVGLHRRFNSSAPPGLP